MNEASSVDTKRPSTLHVFQDNGFIDPCTWSVWEWWPWSQE